MKHVWTEVRDFGGRRIRQNDHGNMYTVYTNIDGDMRIYHRGETVDCPRNWVLV